MNQQTYPEQKLAYTVNESLKILRVSRATLYRIMNQGVLKSKKVGGRRLITHKEIVRLLEE
jgi:excisionase family DNA binding protein